MERMEYFLRRILLVGPTFIGITLLCFALIQFVPGGPVEQAIMQMKGIGAGETARGTGFQVSISDEQRKALEAHFGFDRPFHERYWKWLVTDRLGMRMESYKFPNKTAWQLIFERFQVSLIFGLTGFLPVLPGLHPAGHRQGPRTRRPLILSPVWWFSWGTPSRLLPSAWS